MRQLALVMVVAAHAWGQAPAFDVASLKPAANPGGTRKMDERKGRLDFQNLPLISLIATAYMVPDERVIAPEVDKSQRYDLVATMPPATSRDDQWLMLRTLLKERFKLAVHRETRDLPINALMISPKGSKLQPVETPGPGNRPMVTRSATGNRLAGKLTMGDLTLYARTGGVRRIIDMTGLTGYFDIVLEWAPDDLLLKPGTADPAQPEILFAPLASALETQLGLKLEPRLSPTEVIVVDHVEKTPIGNL